MVPSLMLPVQVAPTNPPDPSPGNSGIDRALALHQRMMATAKDLKVPSILPIPRAHSAGLDTAVIPTTTQKEHVEPSLPDVDDAEKLALFFTGNEIGETDPCG